MRAPRLAAVLAVALAASPASGLTINSTRKDPAMRHPLLRALRALLGVAFCLGAAANASASSIGEIGWWKPEGTGGGRFLQAPATGPVTLIDSASRSGSCWAGSAATSATVTVGNTVVSASTSGYYPSENCGLVVNIGLSGTVEWTDIVFASPGGTGGTANVSLNLLWSANRDSGFNSGLRLLWGQGSPPTPLSGATVVAVAATPLSLTDQLFTTGVFSVPLDVPISFRIGLESDWNGAQIAASGDAQLEVELRSFDIFNLPAGVTVNSASAGIVNNQLVSVPESSAAALVALGMLGLGVARRRPSSDRM
jgi:hypothetical protein